MPYYNYKRKHLVEDRSDEKKIEDEERREKFRKILEKRQAKAKATEDPKDIPNNAENGNEASGNSKK